MGGDAAVFGFVRVDRTIVVGTAAVFERRGERRGESVAKGRERGRCWCDRGGKV